MKTTIAQLLAFACCLCTPGAGSTISVDPSVVNVTAGNQFSLTVDIAGIADLFAVQFDVDFNPAILSVTTVSEGPFLAAGGSTFFLPGTIDNVGGSVASIADSILGPGGGVDGSGGLATLGFTATTAGFSMVSLANIIMLDSSGSAIGVSTLAARVNVSQTTLVPEPAEACFAAITLFCLMATRGKLFRRT